MWKRKLGEGGEKSHEGKLKEGGRKKDMSGRQFDQRATKKPPAGRVFTQLELAVKRGGELMKNRGKTRRGNVPSF